MCFVNTVINLSFYCQKNVSFECQDNYIKTSFMNNSKCIKLSFVDPRKKTFEIKH